MKELAIQAKILKYLRSEYKGCVCYKLEDAKLSGVLDIYFGYKGISVWLEVKRKGGSRSNIQEYSVRKLLKNGIPAAFVNSVEDVKKTLQNVKFLIG